MSTLEDFRRVLGGYIGKGPHGADVLRYHAEGHTKGSPENSLYLTDDGFQVSSFLSDFDWKAEHDRISKLRGFPAWKPNGKGNGKREGRGKLDKRYIYRTASRLPWLRVNRYRDPKGFTQDRWDRNVWTPRLDDATQAGLVIYRLPEVLDAIRAGQTIILNEGEKACDALAELGLVATCSPMGAEKWRESYSPSLKGAHVTIIADNDAPGWRHACMVYRSLLGIAASVKIVQLPGLPPGGDVVDFLEAGGDPATIADMPAAEILAADAEDAATSAQTETTRPTWETPRPDLWASPFILRDPSSIPPREHLYGHLLTRRFLSATIGAPGLGKTTLGIAEMVACATGRPLLGVKPTSRLRTWFFNGEDPAEETERHVAALAIQHGLTRADLEGWFYTGSGRDCELVLAHETRDGATVYAPVEKALVSMIRDLRLDVLSIDPFVSSHRVSENDAGAIDLVCKAWGRIAEQTNTAVHLAHHPRKGSGGDLTVEDGRGSSALVAAARHVRLLNPMSKEEAEALSVERRRSFFRADHGKASLFAPAETAEWYQLQGVCLENGGPLGLGDNVGIVLPWRPSHALDGVTAVHLRRVQELVHAGEYRASDQAEGWAGEAVAQVLGLNLGDKTDRIKVRRVLDVWEREGLFGREERRDSKGMKRPFMVVKRWCAL